MRARKRAAAAARKEALRLNRLRKAEAKQKEQFGKAMTLFQEGKFGLAQRTFERVQDGPDAAFGQRASVYAEICRKKKARKTPLLVSVADYYNHGVQLFNEREYEAAIRVFDRGLRKARKILRERELCEREEPAQAGPRETKTGAQMYYVKAVAMLKLGEWLRVAYPLRKAIEWDPDVRVQARTDPEMRSVIHRHPFSKLVREPDS